MTVLNSLVVFSTISFLFFGISCFLTTYMRQEFVRYGLTKQRELIGVLQILGAIGLSLGYVYLSILGIVSAIGLSLLMILGFIVRLKIKDTLVLAAPSIIYAIINAFIAIALLKSL